METKRVFNKLCGLYFHNEPVSHDPESHDPIISDVIKSFPALEGVSTDKWAAAMATKKKQ